MPSPRIAALIVAAGSGTRIGEPAAPPKQYRLLAGKAVLTRSIEALLAEPRIGTVLVVADPVHEPFWRLCLPDDPRVGAPVAGGATRQSSVRAGLEALAELAPDHVLIHDAARPLVEPATIAAVLDALESHQGAVPALAVTDTIKRSDGGGMIEGTEDRSRLFAAQTPQGFRFAAILAAHRAVDGQDGFTDDAAIAEAAGLDIALVDGSARNFKITHAEDFARAERLLGAGGGWETRIGTGYDVHSLEPGEAVWLGGVEIPFDRRLKGHSDADVALHALSDAIYGALGEGDIGRHFPPSDTQWRGAPSRLFLEHAAGLVAARGGRIVNLDVTIVCEAPKIGPHADAMRAAIADACGVGSDRVGVKATTNETLGFIGREEGIVAMASASVELPRSR